MPEINWKFDAGHALTIIVLLAGMAITWGATSTKLDYNATEIRDVKQQIGDLRDKVDKIRDEQVRNTTILNERVKADDRLDGKR